MVEGAPHALPSTLFERCLLLCRAAGYETIMMNCNPETVSTDYDTSSRLYFEPLTVEDVLNVIEEERPDGIIVQFGGQTPLKLAGDLQAALTKFQIPAASGVGQHLYPFCDNCRHQQGMLLGSLMIRRLSWPAFNPPLVMRVRVAAIGDPQGTAEDG